ncbi:MAG: DUF4252 domain-containing protein [Bacteroidales bacterium]|nr:DUF4252 domain-containing protein [Bacteroidales bacterium]
MKKQIFKLLAIVIMTLPVAAIAQSPADALFDKYSGQEGFTSVYITQHMFGLFADIETEEDESGFMDLVKNLTSIKILTAEKDSTGNGPHVNFYNELIKDFPKNKYEELMVVKKSNQDVTFYIHKEEKKISELLMVVGGADDNALISIQGDIDLKTISKLSKTMNIEGMENLEEIEEK